VIDFKKDEGKDTGTITVKMVKGKKKAGASGEAMQKTFTVTDATKFEKVSGKRRTPRPSPRRLATSPRTRRWLSRPRATRPRA